MRNLHDEFWKRFLNGRFEVDAPAENQQAIAADSTETRGVLRNSSPLLIPLMIAFAVVMAVVAANLRLFHGTRFTRVTEPRVLGLITDLRHVEWTSDAINQWTVGDSVLPGRTLFRSGRIEEQLDSGVRLAIEGPAEFQLIDEDQLRVSHGQLWVDVPSQSIGFKIDTAGLQLEGLDAKFELAVNGSSAKVAVYEGRVSVADPENSQLSQHLDVGCYRIESKSIQQADAENLPLEQFPISSSGYVIETTGAVRYLQSPPQSVRSDVHPDDYVLLFRETTAPVTLQNDLSVTFAGPGRYSDSCTEPGSHQIPAGAVVESFLVHFDSADNDAMKGRGRVRFARPVLGLIANVSQLQATDTLLGSPLTEYERGGQADEADRRWITLSHDRRTLGIDWSHGKGVKQLRVVLAASDDEATAEAALVVPDVAATFTRRYCLECHSDTEAQGGLNLDQLVGDLTDRDAFAHWVAVHDQVMNGQMPPEDAASPPEEQRQEFLAAIAEALTEADLTHRRQSGRTDVRRLNRFEYENTLRDHLALPYLQVKDMLPPDGTAYGYDKSADALEFSHVQIARYMDAADYALARALASKAGELSRQNLRFQVSDPEYLLTNLLAFHSQLRLGVAVPMVGTKIDRTLAVDRGNFALFDYGYVKDPPPHFDGVAIMINSASNQLFWIRPFEVKFSGHYKLRVRGFGIQTKSGNLVPADQTETIAFYANSSRLLGRCDVPPNQPATREVTVWLDANDRIYVLPTSAPNRELKLPHQAPFAWHHFDSRGVCMQWFEMDGPLESGPPESHVRLFSDLPLRRVRSEAPSLTNSKGQRYEVKSRQPAEDARQLLETFTRRVLRREVYESDLELPLQIATTKIANGDGFLDAMLSAYRAVLCAPDFLLLHEELGPLEGRSLAARLSYFLWSSPPDEELMRLGDAGDLLRSEVLTEQVDRLLDDPKAARFVAHFLAHWLDLRLIDLTEPDGDLYPEYNELLLESMVDETRSYFAELLRNDLGVRYIAQSDFAMINQPLAQLYGIPGVRGSDIRKVPLPPGCHRGGLLTQASVLKVTANGTTTSPVVRGAYVLTKFLGSPPPPPPSSVPAVEPDLSGGMTIREQLAKHREASECASCHDLIDPPGFALESFDVMGAYRTRYRAAIRKHQKGVPGVFNGKPARFKIGPVVDASGVMLDGQKFEGIDQFRQQLADRERDMARNLLQQFIAYGTGAPVSFAEREFVESTLDRLETNGYGIRSMIHEIVQSRLFREK